MRIPPVLILLACSDPSGKGEELPTNPTDPSEPPVTTDPGPVTSTTPPFGTSCAIEPGVDLDPDPAVVEIELHAAAFAWDPGTGVPVGDGLAFTGQVPGPLIVVDQGQTLRAVFVNDTEMENTMHWHGLRIPEDQDGVSQMANAVQPGETFLYEFQVPDPGLYWYHPHMDTDMVLERGLYGAIWVRGADEPALDCLVPVVVDDLLVGANGTVASAGMGGMAMERLGDTVLANGTTDLVTALPSGASTVFAVVNVANARYFELKLEDHALSVVGTDGGWLPVGEPVSSILLGPGERYLLHVVAGAPGDYTWTTEVVPLHEGGGMGATDPLGSGPVDVWTVRVTEDPVTTTPLVLPASDPLPAPDAPFAHRWILDEGGMMGGMSFTIDGEEWPDVPWVSVAAYTPSKLEVRNDSDMRHPFHLHGQRFAITSGLSGPAALGWKDTFDVEPGATVSFVTEADNPGDWIYHCHILEHAEGGMAGMFRVE